MCIGFFKISPSRNDRYKLIILNNRDEALDRPTLKMHWHDGFLSGVDEQDVRRGTWLGIDKLGKVGMLLSITQPSHTKSAEALSRGGIVSDFHVSSDSNEFLADLQRNEKKYNGFQFVALERNSEDLYELKTLTNLLVDEVSPVIWSDSEFQVISNSPPNIPLQKAVYGAQIFENHLNDTNNMEIDEIVEKLMLIANDRTTCFPDPQLALQTGYGDEYNKPLSSIFVRFPGKHRYGTRCHTIIIVDQQNKVTVLERRMIAEDVVENSKWEDQRFEFILEQ